MVMTEEKRARMSEMLLASFAFHHLCSLSSVDSIITAASSQLAQEFDIVPVGILHLLPCYGIPTCTLPVRWRNRGARRSFLVP